MHFIKIKHCLGRVYRKANPLEDYVATILFLLVYPSDLQYWLLTLSLSLLEIERE